MIIQLNGNSFADGACMPIDEQFHPVPVWKGGVSQAAAGRGAGGGTGVV